MSPLLILVTTAALGVEVGWEPLAGGGHEYTIQIEPQLLGLLERGTEEILSEVPPELNVRRYRIKVGTGPLPRNVAAPAPPEPAQPDRGPPTGNNDFDRLPPAGANDPDGLPRVEGAGSEDRAEIAPAFPADLQPPGKLPPDGSASGPVEQAGFDAQKPEDAQATAIEMQKPALPDAPSRPWTVLVVSVVLLCCSLGANVYLGWVAWGARSLYRNAVAKLRTAS